MTAIDSAQMEMIKRDIFEIEHPITDIELCQSTLHKLTGYIESAELKNVMHRVVDDLGFAVVVARKRFEALHAATHGKSVAEIQQLADA